MTDASQRKLKLSTIPLPIFIQILMGKVAWWYSLSGVSNGRSLRSGLLEASLALIRQDDFSQYIDDYEVADLLIEGKKRLRIRRGVGVQGTLFPNDLDFATNEALVKALLRALVDWYQEDSKRDDPLPDFERNLVQLIFDLYDSGEEEIAVPGLEPCQLWDVAQWRSRDRHINDFERERSFWVLWKLSS